MTAETMSDVQTNPLGEFIDATEQTNDWSDGDVVRRAVAKGHKLTTSDVSFLRRHGGRMLSPAKIFALADGLELPPHVVAQAALRVHGIPTPDPATPEAAISGDFTLSAKTREILLSIIAVERASAG